jgi:hypothetical protein
MSEAEHFALQRSEFGLSPIRLERCHDRGETVRNADLPVQICFSMSASAILRKSRIYAAYYKSGPRQVFTIE